MIPAQKAPLHQFSMEFIRSRSYPCSVVGTLQRQQGKATVLGIADGDWQVWQVPNGVIVGGIVWGEEECAHDSTCMVNSGLQQISSLLRLSALPWL